MVNVTCPYCDLKLEGPYSLISSAGGRMRLFKDKKQFKFGVFCCPKCGYSEFYKLVNSETLLEKFDPFR